MNTSNAVSTGSSMNGSILELATAGASIAGNLARLERARADQALILEGFEPEPPPVFVGMPGRATATLSLDVMDLPSVGYSDAGDDAIEGDQGEDGAIDDAAGDAAGAASAGDVSGAVSPGVVAQGVAAAAASTITKTELAFLNDKSLTIEEKLFRFMALMTRKSDQDLVAYMKQLAGKSSTSSSSSSGGSGSSTGSSSGAGSSSDPGAPAEAGTPADGTTPSGGIASVDPRDATDATLLGAMVPNLRAPYDRMTVGEAKQKFDTYQLLNLLQRGDPNAYAGFLSALDKVGPVVAEGVAWAAHEYAGPALGAAVTAMGLPELAPIASSVGTDLGDLLGNGVRHLLAEGAATSTATASAQAAAGGSEPGGIVGDTQGVAKATSSSSSSAAAPETMDEKLEFFNLQRMAEKQTAMFGALSNILKTMHESRMSIVQNLR